jgi:hypothetical protein
VKQRPRGFMAEDKIDHDGEIFDYVTELHNYLWQFVRCVKPDASGNLNDYVDNALEDLKLQTQQPVNLSADTKQQLEQLFKEVRSLDNKVLDLHHSVVAALYKIAELTR